MSKLENVNCVGDVYSLRMDSIYYDFLIINTFLLIQLPESFRRFFFILFVLYMSSSFLEGRIRIEFRGVLNS